MVGVERSLEGGQHRLGHVDVKCQTRTANTKCRCRCKAAEIVEDETAVENTTGEYNQIDVEEEC